MTLDLPGGGTVSSAQLGSDAAASDPSPEKGQACKSSCMDSLVSPTPTCSGKQEGPHLVPLNPQGLLLSPGVWDRAASGAIQLCTNFRM